MIFHLALFDRTQKIYAYYVCSWLFIVNVRVAMKISKNYYYVNPKRYVPVNEDKTIQKN